jgi:hypothetical protein
LILNILFLLEAEAEAFAWAAVVVPAAIKQEQVL